MIATAEGLNYSHLAQSLRGYGFTETIDARGRTFDHPSGARIPLPALSDDAPLRLHHLVATRGVVSDYGIAAAYDFDLTLLRLRERSKVHA